MKRLLTGLMRAGLILIITLAASLTAAAQERIKLAPNFRIGPASPCRGADLSVRHVSDDAAMGGHNFSKYAFKNNSASPCTLKGYPRFELLGKTGVLMPKGRAINSAELPGDEWPKKPELVRIAAGQEAMFRVYTNNGGAGRVGKPCPTSSKVRIVAPGTTRVFTLSGRITSCEEVQVSSVKPIEE